MSGLRRNPGTAYKSVPYILSQCTSLKTLEQTHSQIIKKGLEQDHFLITRFISLLPPSSSSLSLSYAISVFSRVSSPNIYLWNTFITTHSNFNSNLTQLLALFRNMMTCKCSRHLSLTDNVNRNEYNNTPIVFNNYTERNYKIEKGRCPSMTSYRVDDINVTPDECTFSIIIKSCCRYLALSEGEVIHGLVFRYGVEMDVYLGSSLIDFYGKCGKVLCARKVFDEMSVRNEFSWTSLVVGYVVAGDVGNAKKVFDEMRDGKNVNIVSWNSMLTGFARVGDVASARKLFDEIPERNYVSFTVMIDLYAKSGDMASARFLFEKLGKKDIVSWSALISGYAQNNQPHEAVKVFTEMQSKRVKPDDYVLVSLMCACSQIGSLEMARWVESYLSVNSFDIRRPHVLAALVHMNAKCGNMERATTLFEEMPQKDLISFCSMIQGLSVHGRADKAVVLFKRMLSEGLVPDNVAFTVILTSCSRGGLVEEGCQIFTSMVNDYSVIPTSHHYACMVDLFGRAGKLNAAYELLKLMPVEPHVGVWGALLGACKLHCDIELGEEIASRLFEIEPLNAGNYVAMSDIYAQLDRWLDVSLVRQKMNERGIRKLRGCSWI